MVFVLWDTSSASTFFIVLKMFRIFRSYAITTLWTVDRFSDSRYDITQFEPPLEYLTVARMVNVTDDNVFNVLVDQTQMESILMVESDSLARKLMAEKVGIVLLKNSYDISA